MNKELNKSLREPDAFDKMCEEFTVACATAAAWKHVYFGAAYSTRIKAAIKDLEDAIAKAKANPEIGC